MNRETMIQVASSYVGQVHKAEDFGMLEGQHWCGGFALHCLHESGIGTDDLKWEIGKGFLYRLPRVNIPKPGDLVYFHRKQHHAIFERFERNMVCTIDGNQSGGLVARRKRPKSWVAGYYSIENLIGTDPDFGGASECS